MQLYIDTASIDEIREAASMGILDGVTTNPSLVAKEGVDFRERLDEICQVVPGPVSAEVIATEHQAMIEEAMALTEIAGNIVVKLPSTVDGLQACRALSDKGIRTNLTLCFQPLQALLQFAQNTIMQLAGVGRPETIIGRDMEHRVAVLHGLDQRFEAGPGIHEPVQQYDGSTVGVARVTNRVIEFADAQRLNGVV